MNNKHGLQFTANVPYECTFIKRNAINKLETHSVPPLTTIRGMIYNAMARPSIIGTFIEDTKIEQELKFRKEFENNTQIGIEIIDPGIKSSTLHHHLKSDNEKKGTIGDTESKEIYITQVTQRETIIKPTYKITILSDNQEKITTIKEHLEKPKRPLFLGKNDNIVNFPEINTTTFSKKETPQEWDNRTLVVPNTTGNTLEILPTTMEKNITGRTSRQGDSTTISYENAKSEFYYSPNNKDFSPTVPID